MGSIQKVYVVAFILEGDKLLIAKRSLKSSFLPGYFELPGGKVEFGEEPKDALKRELREELGVEAEVGEPFHAFSFVIDEKNVHGVEIAYHVQIKDLAKLSLTEHEAVAWVTRQDLDDYMISEKEKQAMAIGFEKSE